MARIGLDPDGNVVNEHYALVYVPRRRRDRFPENCVQLVESEALALAGADAKRHLFAARVLGPSRSSEGFRLYLFSPLAGGGRIKPHTIRDLLPPLTSLPTSL